MPTIPIEKIVINRGERQRRELKNIDVLAESIKRNAETLPETGGLIHPIVVTRDHILVAGERRLTACKMLGYTSIAANYADELDSTSLMVIELEENIKREDISWQDQCRAMEAYHAARKANEPDWTLEKTSEAIGVSKQDVSAKLKVAKELSNPRIAEAPKFSVARGIVERASERKDAAAVESLRAAILPKDTALDTPVQIIEGNFNEWARKYSGQRFNLIHCDFPYGIGADGFNQGGAAAHGGYVDSEDTYWELLGTLASNIDRVCADSCHIVFWFSMHYYAPTLDFFKRNTDFKIDPFPLIWLRSDNAGILPDPTRGPRRVYETAFFGHRGDRKIVGAVGNAYAAPTVRDRHMSEKPEPMLRHFFRMLVDEHSLVLDPTAGSGSSIRAARSLKCKRALGLEINPEFVARANAALKGGTDA